MKLCSPACAPLEAVTLRPLAVALAVLLISDPAAAFCRSTSCNQKQATCRRNDQGCIIDGAPLFWPAGEIAVSVSARASLDGITGEQTDEVARAAFATWQAATCEHGLGPRLSVRYSGQRGDAEVNGLDGINLITFVDSDWTDSPEAVAITTVTFGASTGRIVDADTRVNSAQYCIIGNPSGIDSAVCDPLLGGNYEHPVDLLGVLTHEAGHQLGLDHTLAAGATMTAQAAGFRYQELRTLDSDDEAGICAAYPSTLGGEIAGGGLACRTAVTRGPRADDNWWPALAIAMLLLAKRRRNRIASARPCHFKTALAPCSSCSPTSPSTRASPRVCSERTQ